MYSKIEKCRVCSSTNLSRVLDLGEQMLTGVFPKGKDEKVTVGPLCLVKCSEEKGGCGLLQLEHSYDLGEMYGENYGYRSGLNAAMVAHLKAKVDKITNLIPLRPGDLVVDIGSNDSTTLQAYDKALRLVGIDPTGVKFRQYYPAHIQLISEFFSAKLLKEKFPGSKAKVVTSFSMFYDLEDPMAFMRHVHEVLADDGIWVFEQSYMPTMLEMNSYDTACHEHLEYYGLSQIKWMADRVGFKILDVEFNTVNGGSFSVTVAKSYDGELVAPAIQAILDREKALGLHTLAPYREFADRVAQTRIDLLAFLTNVHAEGKMVAALGASTKGNVLLQYCNVSERDIAEVGEVNKEKFGNFTPGTFLPIRSEDEVLARNPDYLLVLPWHFRDFFRHNPKFAGRTLLFPLPQVETERMGQ